MFTHFVHKTLGIYFYSANIQSKIDSAKQISDMCVYIMEKIKYQICK